MIVSRLEALADAIMKYSGYGDPESDNYRFRNPGSLRGFTDKHLTAPDGKRVFKSFLDGYQALLFDLKVKCTGKSNTRLTQESSLTDLMTVYGQPATSAKYIAKFLKRALDDQSITDKTPLKFFVEAI